MDKLPVLHRDGISDDTAAIQAQIDGRPYQLPNGKIINDLPNMPEIGRHDTRHQRGCVMRYGAIGDGGPTDPLECSCNADYDHDEQKNV